MQKSWLLRYPLLIVVATREALAYSHEAKASIEIASSAIIQNSPRKELASHEVVIPEATEKKTELERVSDGLTGPTSVPVERESLVWRLPRPTATSSLPKRQDDGQVQALSAQLQSLSQSATQAISSVSSSASSAMGQISQSAQSVRQSADQAVQSANQAADQANRQLSQTQSSASSAVSAANSRANDQISQSLASMSSRISVNLASAQSSASNAISSAQSVASQFAASQIQAAKVAASGATGDANSLAEQVRSNSISASNVAIITTASIVGTAILSTVSSCLFLRYRRKRRASRREEAPASNEKTYDKPVAVRGSLSPRFPRFGRGSGSPLDNFKLPRLSPLVQSKRARREEENNIGFADSDYSDQAGNTKQNLSDEDNNKLNNMDGMQPATFRLQKNNGVSSATTVRLIRVGSEKGKANSYTDDQQARTEPMPASLVAAPDRPPKQTPVSIPSQPTTQSLPQANTIITQPPKTTESPSEPRRVSVRSTRNLDDEMPGWRPPMRSTVTSQNRFRFRDSSDIESGEPTPTDLGISSPLNTNISSLRMSRPANVQKQNDSDKTLSSRRPKNAGASFATFPRVRNEPLRESMLNRGRPNLNLNGIGARLRVEEERRRKELAEIGNARGNRESVRSSRAMFSDR
ncbi:hypothetical protein HD806DRAFT_344540 [Xylariaceae sp. AK1471]|nr:hypothetical protein HD806DRAFT_344540 [Xylariaceae sp. AK1471]